MAESHEQSSLEKWYEDYQEEFFDAIKIADNDILDEESIERRLEELRPSMQIQDGYCAICQGFLKTWLDRCSTNGDKSLEFYLPWHVQLIQLEAASRRGCHFCRLWMQDIKPENLQKARKIEKRLQGLGKSCLLTVATSTMDNGRHFLYLCFPGRSYSQRSWLPLALINGDKSSDSFSGNGSTNRIEPGQTSLETAKSWLTECSTNHTLCNIRRTEGLPSRLLAVNEEPIKIVLTKDWTTKPHYATLSHCWGNLKFLNLTRDSLKSFMARVPIEQSPKTFQDAVLITRQLGIDYLWIDSLCIIQDSDQDWAAESALMSSVYGNSRITIAAAAAHDGTVGCLVQPPDDLGRRAHVEDTVDSQATTYIFVPNEFDFSSVTNSPLASRAWALQERLLSPRMLHFCANELFWECKEKVACESFPETFPKALCHDDSDQRQQPLHDSWHRIVFLYTSADLTYGKDKLVAFSGIARAAKDEIVKSEIDDEYIAGMWRQDLETQLCWSIDNTSPRPSTYRAPTWSWASVDGQVYYTPMSDEYRSIDRYAHVLDVKVTPTGTDLFGQLEGGVLKFGLKYMLLGRFLGRQVWYNVLVPFLDSEIKFRIDLDTNDDLVESGGLVYMIPIARTFQFGVKYLKGIVVRPTNAEKGQFSRMGSFTERDVGYKKDEYEKFSQAIHEVGTETARDVCAEVITDPEEMFVINIV